MQLVLDANIVFSFFRDNPVRFILLNSNRLGVQLVSPSYVLEELRNNIPDLVKYTKLPPNEVESILSVLDDVLELVPQATYKQYESKARSVSPHDKDIPYFALALFLNCGIWSNEPRFKRQSVVAVFNTREVRVRIGV